MIDICNYCSLKNECKNKTYIVEDCSRFNPDFEPITKAAEIYSHDKQEWNSVGTFGMLLHTLEDYKRNRCDENQVAKKIADAEIALDQLKVIYNCRRKALLWRSDKLKRLAKNLIKEMIPHPDESSKGG